jgi:hypothetical protein
MACSLKCLEVLSESSEEDSLLSDISEFDNNLSVSHLEHFHYDCFDEQSLFKKKLCFTCAEFNKENIFASSPILFHKVFPSIVDLSNYLNSSNEYCFDCNRALYSVRDLDDCSCSDCVSIFYYERERFYQSLDYNCINHYNTNDYNDACTFTRNLTDDELTSYLTFSRNASNF